METLFEVGLVEALAAGIFIGFCAFISFLLRSNRMSEAELTEMLHQISDSEPVRSSSQSMSYRGNRYQAPQGVFPFKDTDVEIHVKPSQQDVKETLHVPDAVVKMTYRGVSYVKPCFKNSK